MENELKFRLLEDDYIMHRGKKAYRIQALKNFADVQRGDKGGYV